MNKVDFFSFLKCFRGADMICVLFRVHVSASCRQNMKQSGPTLRRLTAFPDVAGKWTYLKAKVMDSVEKYVPRRKPFQVKKKNEWVSRTTIKKMRDKHNGRVDKVQKLSIES